MTTAGSRIWGRYSNKLATDMLEFVMGRKKTTLGDLTDAFGMSWGRSVHATVNVMLDDGVIVNTGTFYKAA